MRKKEQVLAAIYGQKLLPLYYHDDGMISLRILEALYAGGIRVLEYTSRGENAVENFRLLRKEAGQNMKDLLLGIGTVKSRKQAKKFIEAGADFIVCPSMDEEVAEVVEDAKLLWVPGCMTPTEIASAENTGAELIKIFPGNILGPGYISSIKEIFPGLKFLVTGGVEAEAGNLKAWFGAGVAAVGMGSKLLTREMMQTRDYAAMEAAARNALLLIQENPAQMLHTV